MLARSLLVKADQELALTDAGRLVFEEFGVDLNGLESKRTVLCRECLDWSERRSHLAGSLGRALLAEIQSKGWAKREEGTRIMRFTRNGEAALDRWIQG